MALVGCSDPPNYEHLFVAQCKQAITDATWVYHHHDATYPVLTHTKELTDADFKALMEDEDKWRYANTEVFVQERELGNAFTHETYFETSIIYRVGDRRLRWDCHSEPWYTKKPPTRFDVEANRS